MGEDGTLESWEYQGGTFTAAGSWLPVGGKIGVELEGKIGKISPYYIFENKYPISQRFKNVNYKNIILKLYIEDVYFDENRFYYLSSWAEKSVQLVSKTKENADLKSLFSFANPVQLTDSIYRLSYKNSFIIIDWSYVNIEELNLLGTVKYDEGISLSPNNFKNIDSTYSRILQSEKDITYLKTGIDGYGIKEFTLDYSSGGSKQTPFTIYKGTTIHLSGNINTVTCRTNEGDFDYQTITDGTVADRDINYMKSQSSGSLIVSLEYLSCTKGINELYTKLNALKQESEIINVSINGYSNSEFTLTYESFGQQQTPFTIYKGTTIHLSGTITTITCRTNKDDVEYQTVTDGTVADRDINYIKSGEAGTVSITVDYKTFDDKDRELSDRISSFDEIVSALGYKSEDIEESETYNKSTLNSSGEITSSNTATTTVGVYDIANSNFVYLSMRTGNVYNVPYLFFNSNDILLSDTNEFPTIVDNGITVDGIVLVCPEGATKLKITYNNSVPHHIKSVTKNFVLSTEFKNIPSNIILAKEGNGIAYRTSSKFRLRPLKILGVGNSWTINATKCLGEILTNLGVKVEIGVSLAGGATLQAYWNSIKANSSYPQFHRFREGAWDRPEETKTYKEIFLADEWDIVTHQQQSGNGGNYSSFQPYLHSILKWEKEICKVMPLFFMHATWSYTDAYVNEQFEELYQSSSTTMYNKILEAYNQAMLDEGIVNVMPSAPMVQQVRELGIEWIDLADGGSHLAGNGEFAVGCVWAEMLFRNYFDKSVASDLSIENSTYKPSASLSDEDAAKIRTLAKEIVENVRTYFPNQE